MRILVSQARAMSRNRWLLVVIALFVAWQLWSHRAPEVGEAAPRSSRSATVPGAMPVGGITEASKTGGAGTRRVPSTITEREPDRATRSINPDGLPPEASATLRLIRAGGPFPYDRDGIVFGNFEGRLPKHARGYYHEYTVPTPGISHRGVRRIITGGKPPSEFWYTDDHYESFRQIGGAP